MYFSVCIFLEIKTGKFLSRSSSLEGSFFSKKDLSCLKLNFLNRSFSFWKSYFSHLTFFSNLSRFNFLYHISINSVIVVVNKIIFLCLFELPK